MKNPIDGNAIVYCEGGFSNANGKTAHGLVRFTERYRTLAILDSECAGKDAGEVLEGAWAGIPIFDQLGQAMTWSTKLGLPAQYFVIGLAPDGGALPGHARVAVCEAIRNGLHIVSGLHDFLSEDREIASLAKAFGVTLYDVRKPLPRKQLHFFSGKIAQVESLKIALLGTDSAVGKRTTAWSLVHALHRRGIATEMIGTGQTAWMQGARYGLILDSLVNDFVAGELEHAVWSAWSEAQPQVIVVEGQGSLLNPAYPGGFEILAATRPDFIVLQHDPTRSDYDGFPGHKIHSLSRQIAALQAISETPILAITLNHGTLARADILPMCDQIQLETGYPTFDVLIQTGDPLAELVISQLRAARKSPILNADLEPVSAGAP